MNAKKKIIIKKKFLQKKKVWCNTDKINEQIKITEKIAQTYVN